MLTQKIAGILKAAVKGIDEKRMQNLLAKQYDCLHLMDERKNWLLPSLNAISGELLPNDLTEEKTVNFIDEIARLAEANPYLVSFLKRVDQETFPVLAGKVSAEGAVVIPELVAYAWMLECLTRAMYNDYRIALEFVPHFQKERNEPNSFNYVNYFHKLKLKSVEIPIKKNIAKRFGSGIISPQAYRWTLPINILEACLTDYMNGYKHNARAGRTLMVNRPGRKTDHPLTGAGPSRWSENKKAVSVRMPMPKQWADLYQTWNMAFVMQFPVHLYLLPKLLIPQVASYQNAPTEYIYKRVLALYLVVNYSGFCVQAKANNKEQVADWRDSKLTKLWGESNLESAKAYEELVQSLSVG
jgi:hypothetical protein